jgi:hypothetical protein
VSVRNSFGDHVQWSTLQKIGAACAVVAGLCMPVAVFLAHADQNASKVDVQDAIAPLSLGISATRSEMMQAQRAVRILQLREVVRSSARKNASRPALRYDAEVIATAAFDEALGAGVTETEAYNHAMSIHVP